MNTSNGTHRNDHLRQERARHNWRQHDLAEQLGTTVVTVKRWERGSQQPSPYFRVKLCTLFGKSAEDLGLISDASSEETALWDLPFPRNPFFTGRDLVLDQLYATLTNEPRRASLTRSYALSGLGGIGKTQLAIEYAYRSRSEYTAVFWVEAETRASLTSSFVRLAGFLALPEQTEEDQSKIVAAVLRWLNRHEGWLLIFDNVEDLSLIKPFLPANDQGALLLTTRLQTLGSLARRIGLPPMNTREGCDFLLARTNRPGQDEEHTSIASQEHMAAQAIVTKMGGLPLALEQAGAYIDATQCSLLDYLRLFQDMQCHLLDEHEASSDHPLSVSRTFTLAFERVEQRNPLAADLLRACAFLAPEAIPETFFLQGASLLGSTFEVISIDPLAFAEAIKVLLSYSLIQRNALTHTITIHRLVQVVLKEGMDEQTQQLWRERSICVMNCLFPEATFVNWPHCQQYLPHALQSTALIEQYTLPFPEAGQLLHKTGWYLVERGLYIQAEPLLQHALSIREQLLGPDHPDIASTLDMLAGLAYLQGRYEQAELLLQRALRIRESILGSEHLETADTLDTLALVYYFQGRYTQAEPLYQRALAVKEQFQGPEHLDTGATLNNLALLYQAQGRYEEAEPLYQRVLKMHRNSVCSEHPDTAIAQDNLGTLYCDQGKYEQARQLYEQALAIKEKVHSLDHPDIAISFLNLGRIAHAKCEHGQAEALFRRALAIQEKGLGPESAAMAYTLKWLALLYQDQDRHTEAEEIYAHALEISEKMLGREHPHTAAILNDHAQMYERQGHQDQAKALYQRALAIREQTYGSEHLETVETRNALMRLLQEE